jgi:hypothetical protein
MTRNIICSGLEILAISLDSDSNGINVKAKFSLVNFLGVVQAVNVSVSNM